MNAPDQTVQPSAVSKKPSQRTRSPAYPSISLEDALEKAKAVWDHEKRNPAPITALATDWGQVATSSVAVLTASALRKYGLLEEVEGGKERMLKLSQTALSIILNDQEASPERIALLKQCALAPKIHAALWQHFNGDLPSDATLKRHLILERNFNGASVDAFIKDFRDTISFAKLSTSDKITIAGNGDIEEDLQGRIEAVAPEAPKENIVQMQAKFSGSSSLSAAATVLREFTFPLSSGMASLKVPYPIGEDDFDFFLETLKLWKKKLVRGRQYPARAIWKNEDFDKAVTIRGEMGSKDGVRYFQSEDGTGIPENELTFEA